MDIPVLYGSLKDIAVDEGLEPPQACARRFSRPLQYQLCESTCVNFKTTNLLILLLTGKYFFEFSHILSLRYFDPAIFSTI